MHKLTGLALAAMLLTGAVHAAENPQVSMKTTMGEIILELDQEKAPVSTANFMAYVKSGFYKDTIFHRVINGFMIQGGGYTADLKSKPGLRPTIKSEAKNGLSNLAYTIAMARHDDPNSGQSQWFINVADNIGLDFPLPDGKGYAVFGRVIQGKETVDKIKAVLVDDKPNFQNLPVTPIVVKSVTVLKTRIVPPPETPATPPPPEAQPQQPAEPAPVPPPPPPAEPTPPAQPAPTPEAVK